MQHLLLVVVPKEPRVSKEVFLKIADVFLNLGYISVASIIVPFIFEKSDIGVVAGGMFFALVCWFLALRIVQKYHS
jgi:hypothetical protein